MNNYSLYFVLFFSLLVSERVNYWNLGISINKNSQVVVQKPVNLDNIKIELKELSNPEGNRSGNTVYTLKTNTFIQPKPVFINDDIDSAKGEENIKALILSEQYFDAAKQIISLNSESILEQFSNFDEFYYLSSLVFYNLGNYSEARNNIILISSREHNPETIFLEALILQEIGESGLAFNLLHQIINEFPNSDYTDYAKNILIEESND